MMTDIMKTLYKFFKTAEVSQEIIIHQKVKVEKYNLVKSYYLMQSGRFLEQSFKMKACKTKGSIDILI
jgi:hypothetical protein